MAEKLEKYKDVLDEVTKARDLLSRKEILPEDDCVDLIHKIEKLPENEIPLSNKENGKVSIESILEEFNKCAASSRSRLEALLATIAEGKIPSECERKELDKDFDMLCCKYDDMRKMADKELAENEMPKQGSSIYAYFDAIQNSKATLLKEQLDNVIELLNKYLSVKSLIANLSLALEPFQKDARVLLERINAGEIKTVDEISDKVAGPQLFIQALEHEDLTSDEGDEIIDALEGEFNYPSRVTRGLLGKSYFITNEPNLIEQVRKENTNLDGQDTQEKTVTVSAESSDVRKVNDDKSIGDEDETKSTIDSLLLGEITSEELGNENVDEEKDVKPDSRFVISLRDAKMARPKDDYGILSSDISDAESKKISSSVFLSDLKKVNARFVRNVIKQTDDFGLINPELLNLRFDMNEVTAEGCLDFLLKRGYLRRYRVMPGGEFYCPSPRLEKALTYREAAKAVGVKQHQNDFADEYVEDMASCAATRVALLKLFTLFIKSYQQENYRSYSVCGNLMDESFSHAFFSTTDEFESLIIAGAFWTEYLKCDEFLDGFRELAKDNLAAKRLIVAGLNINATRMLAKTILECAEVEFDNFKITLYALYEDRFFDFKTNEEIREDDLWPDLIKLGKVENPKDDSVDVQENLPISGEAENENDKEPQKTQNDNESPTVPKEEPVLGHEKPTEIEQKGKVLNNIYRLLSNKKFYCACAYAKAMLNKKAISNDFHELIAFSLDEPTRHCLYSVDGVFDMTSSVSDYFTESLMTSIGLRTFFSNQVQYEFNIKSLYDAIKSYQVLDEHPSLRAALYDFVDFKDQQKKGLDYYAAYHAKSIAQLDEMLKKVQRDAKTFYDNIIMGKKSEKASQKRFLETKKMIFDPKGDIGQYIKAVVDNEKSMLELLEDYLKSNFIKEGNTLSESNIDAEMLWKFITDFWEQAGDKMVSRHRSDLMSQLRSNIVNATTKALQIMIRWCNLTEKLSNQAEDDGSVAYKKIQKRLINEIEESITSVDGEITTEGLTDNKKAGLQVVQFTLNEIKKCIDGTYDENEKAFFYVQFLSTEDVLLDESFCPDLTIRSLDIEKLQPENRILAHAAKEPRQFDVRLKEILEDGYDDYGSAKLIIDYLRATSPDFLVDGYVQNIEDGESYARDRAEYRKNQFIGDLELAYVSGQIGNYDSSENKKEQILQIVDEWYEWACESSNYGFLGTVMDEYLSEIRRKSKSREKDLIAQLEAFKETSIPRVTAEVKEKKVQKVQLAIQKQNYTVAEDLLARASQTDDELEDIIDEWFLKDFLNNYGDYYRTVAMNQTSIAALVGNRTRNKEERGAKKLADNWLPGGGNLGKDRLVGLMVGFGFNVNANTVQQQTSIGKFESFLVKTIAAKGGKRDNYTHPIAAFGSGASQDGFRVVCVNGKYDAAGLIDIMKQIGNAKHTMILLNCALDEPERHLLARKSKSELGDKLFVVVDRVVMMYLIKNYDETKTNRMLMALVAPFGYYQPYVWESSIVMPPEIFMGRKRELESIESPSGANIVYGGRQLGKSALLKKAKADIDKDENGNRAVLIDIKYLDHTQAAKRIADTLFDEGILEKELETPSWDDLSRAVKKRLQSQKNSIPYLLLLLDEADAFIESCESINYRPLDALKDIQSVGTGRFKFVIAGLRNIVRFKRDAALGNNSVLTHLESMTVKPFQTNEARELMEIPLHYLGFEFPKENESLLTLILASTNYFPGLIQMYCAKLLSAMRNKDYAGYAETTTPIYEISEAHIKKVLADPEFMEQIKEKFIITLKLDEDNYYYLIALIMAYLYHNNGYNDGYSVSDIKKAGRDLEISKIADLDDVRLGAFMEELKELNVLRSTNSDHYLFTRFSFFQMMGSRSEVDDKLVEYMGE